MECNSCKMCKSADERLEKFVASKEFDTAFHRTETQKQKCGFGLQGVCCRLCSNGPCRVTPKSPKGICGADADTIVARNLLLNAESFPAVNLFLTPLDIALSSILSYRFSML